MQTKNNNNKIKYPLAPAERRIVAKIFDIAIVSCLILAIGFSIFCTDPNFKWNESLHVEGWRYGLFVSLVFLIFVSLLFIIPCLWKKTIGMFALKLSYLKKTETNIIFCLFKHELFVWELIVIIALIMGIVLSCLNQYQIDSLIKGANSIFVSKLPDNIDKTCFYVGTGFSCVYGICIIFLIVIIIGVCVKNNKLSFHDKYSSLCIYLKKTQNNLIKKSDVKSDESIKVPGQISDDSLEEIDNI